MMNHLCDVRHEILVIFTLFVGANSVLATEPDPAMKKIVHKMIGAIKTADREAFIAEGTDTVKKETTQEIMDELKEKFGERFTKGVEATYFGELKQEGYQVHLWKLTFKDQGDDMLLRLVLKEKQVAGFFLR